MFLNEILPSQDRINASEFVYQKGNTKVYAATLNAKTVTPIQLKKGDKFTIDAVGNIQFSAWQFSSGPDGQSISDEGRIPGIKHGALIMRIGKNDNWRLIGHKKSFVAHTEGILELAVNEKSTYNNKGYFDVKIQLINP